jgi:putative membrane protein
VTALPTEWARLHKLSPVLRFVRSLTGLAIVLAPNQIVRGQRWPAWADIALLALALVAGVVSWLVTRWRIHNGELQVETGLIRRESVRIPVTRLQAVDVVRPLLGRLLGLAEVRVVVAGQGTNRGRLAYLDESRATEVRAQLLALAHGLEHDTPEPPERPIIQVPGHRIVLANALSGAAVISGLLVLGTILLTIAAPRAGLATASSALPLALVLVLGLSRQVGAEWEFRLSEAPDGLRLHSGLLQTRAETIPYGRIQAVRWLQPLWWRWAGWVRLEVDVARRHDRDRSEGESSTTTRALLPVGPPELAEWLLSRVLPGAQLHPGLSPDRFTGAGRVGRAPRRAILRAPLSYHFLGAWHDDRYVVCGTGRVRRSIVVVPLEKAQSIRWVQGPLARLLKLGSIHVDTAGRRFAGSAEWRSEAEAAQWVRELPDLARAARNSKTMV